MGASSGSRASTEPASRLGHSGFDPERYRTERYDAICTRILCADTAERPGWAVAIIEQLTNGRWVISVGDQRYTRQTFPNVKSAFKWWQERQSAIAIETQSATTAGRGPKDESAG